MWVALVSTMEPSVPQESLTSRMVVHSAAEASAALTEAEAIVVHVPTCHVVARAEEVAKVRQPTMRARQELRRIPDLTTATKPTRPSLTVEAATTVVVIAVIVAATELVEIGAATEGAVQAVVATVGRRPGLTTPTIALRLSSWTWNKSLS